MNQKELRIIDAWLTNWIAQQWQSLPEKRTDVAHGKADLLRALTTELDRWLGVSA